MRLDHVATLIVTAHNRRVKSWEIIADRLSKAGWSWGCVLAILFQRANDLDCLERSSRDDGKRFVVRSGRKAQRILGT